MTAWLRNANKVAEPSVYAQLTPRGTLRHISQRSPGDSAVRSSSQSTTEAPASIGNGCVGT